MIAGGTKSDRRGSARKTLLGIASRVTEDPHINAASGGGGNEEYAADRHGVVILQRAGYPAATMRNTLIWLTQTEGANGGGFFATHPASGDRIEALRNVC